MIIWCVLDVVADESAMIPFTCIIQLGFSFEAHIFVSPVIDFSISFSRVDFLTGYVVGHKTKFYWVTALFKVWK